MPDSQIYIYMQVEGEKVCNWREKERETEGSKEAKEM